jgi:hypothetical protein
MNCPYETWEGECTKGSRKPFDGYCREHEIEEYNEQGTEKGQTLFKNHEVIEQ